MKAINTVIDAVKNSKAEDGLTAAEDSRVAAAFDRATNEIKQCFEEYGVRLSYSLFFYALNMPFKLSARDIGRRGQENDASQGEGRGSHETSQGQTCKQNFRLDLSSTFILIWGYLSSGESASNPLVWYSHSHSH